LSYAILLYPGVEPIDVGATFGVLSMAGRRIPGLKFFGVAAAKGPVKCAGNLIVHADHDFQSCPEAGNVIATGGPGWLAASRDRAMLEFLQTRAAQPATRISSICTGAMILAAAGLLEGHPATTKHEVFDGETSPAAILAQMNVNVRPEAIVETGEVLTSGGVTLGLDAVFRLLAINHGQDVADDVARVMEYTRALDANHEALGYQVK